MEASVYTARCSMPMWKHARCRSYYAFVFLRNVPTPRIDPTVIPWAGVKSTAQWRRLKVSALVPVPTAESLWYNRASPFRIYFVKDGQIDDWFWRSCEKSPRLWTLLCSWCGCVVLSVGSRRHPSSPVNIEGAVAG
jgi:hypothetical protein